MLIIKVDQIVGCQTDGFLPDGLHLRLLAKIKRFWQMPKLPKGVIVRNYIKVLLKVERNSAKAKLPKLNYKCRNWRNLAETILKPY